MRNRIIRWLVAVLVVSGPWFPTPATASAKLDVIPVTQARIDINSLAPMEKVPDYDVAVLQPLHQAEARQAAIEAAQAVLDAKIALEAQLAREAANVAATASAAIAAQPAPATSANGNDYAFGNCTSYVASRTAVPMSMGDATNWDRGLLAAGWHYGLAPGSIGVSHAGYAGHVVIVESVLLGVATISEMNGEAGFNRVDTRVALPGEFTYLSR